MNHGLRWLHAAALAMLLPATGTAVARSFKLVEGDPAKCAPYEELASMDATGHIQHDWHPDGEYGIRTIGDFGTLFIRSPPSPVTLIVVKWPKDEPVFMGQYLTFRFIAHPGGGAGASRTFRALSE
ncbi:MAG: hypothetical protein AB7S36_23990, partial [Planctomycetota bacterium]